MRHSLRMLALASLAAPALTVATPAFAQEDETSGPLDIEFTLAAVSDYRFRGISLSDKDPAFQPELSISHESGVYLTLWGSNIADNGGDDIEVDVTAGWAGKAGPVNLDVGAIYYLYPGASGLNYVEALASVGTDVGKGNVALNLGYVPSQNNTGNQDNVYVAVSGEYPVGDSGLTLNGSFGIEDGAFADNKRDWSIGADYELAGFTLGVKYVDTAHTFGNPLGKATAVFSVSKPF